MAIVSRSGKERMGQRVRWGEEVWSRDGCGSFPAGTFSGSFSCVAKVSLPPIFFSQGSLRWDETIKKKGKAKKLKLNNLFFVFLFFLKRERNLFLLLTKRNKKRNRMTETDLYISFMSDHLSGQSNTAEMTFHLFAWPVTAFHPYSHLLWKRVSKLNALWQRAL